MHHNVVSHEVTNIVGKKIDFFIQKRVKIQNLLSIFLQFMGNSYDFFSNLLK